MMLAVREGLLIRGGEGIMAKMDRQVTPSFFVSKIYAIYANIEGGEGDQTNFAITIVTQRSTHTRYGTTVSIPYFHISSCLYFPLDLKVLHEFGFSRVDRRQCLLSV